MTHRTRRNHSATFKFQVALAALKADKTLSKLSSEFDVHQNQIIDWRNQMQAHIHSAYEAYNKTVKTFNLAAKSLINVLKPVGFVTYKSDLTV